MRLSAIVFAACLLALPALAAAQAYSSGSNSGSSVLRPAAYGDEWRNYVGAPAGPCGPMTPVRADCYPNCRPCGLHPVCFLRRVGRMLDCLLPCNTCHSMGCGACGSGGLFHGCVLGGRCGGNPCCGAGCGSWGNGCSSCSGGYGCAIGCGAPTGCASCSSTVPALSDPFQDDPLPPKPTAQPAEARRSPPRSIPAAGVQTNTMPKASPWKVTSGPASPARKSTNVATAAGHSKQPASQSVLRRTSSESAVKEPAPLDIDHSRVAPIVRSQSPADDAVDYTVPRNPLRRN